MEICSTLWKFVVLYGNFISLSWGKKNASRSLSSIDTDSFVALAAAAGLCSNLDRQVMVDLMVLPPAPGEESHARFAAERAVVYGALRRKTLPLLLGFPNSVERCILPAAAGRHASIPPH